MESVSADDVRKRLLEKPRFELAVKGVGLFRLGRCYIFWQGVPWSLGQQVESTELPTVDRYRQVAP